MVTQVEAPTEQGDRKKTTRINPVRSTDFSGAILIVGYSFLVFLGRLVLPLIDSVSQAVERWYTFLHYH